MNVVMSGVSASMADAAARERCALTQARQAALLERAAADPRLPGTLVLSTCGRTEIYLSLPDGEARDPFSLIGAEDEPHETLSGRACFEHLASLAAGALSPIFGDDQILAQVKSSLAAARGRGALDGVLEVFFREAIAAAKRIKTELRLPHGDRSAAWAARELLRGLPGVRSVLVIGNGEIGRLSAELLARGGWTVSMTLRQYLHSSAVIPEGVSALPYEARYARLSGFDAVVSATSSPHWTISARELAGISPLPRVFLDLAMPRDIDPAVGLLPGVTLLDIDAVSARAPLETARAGAREQLAPYLEDGWRELTRWEANRAPMDERPRTHFPLFVDCSGKKALIVGGGKIAARRVRTLADFAFELTVVAPEAQTEILRLAEAGRLEYLPRAFEEQDLDGAFLVLAATDDRAVNHRVAMLARHRGVFASIADDRDECSFFFPAVAKSGRVTVGVCGDGSAHPEVSAAAKKIREVLHEP